VHDTDIEREVRTKTKRSAFVSEHVNIDEGRQIISWASSILCRIKLLK